MVLLDNLPSFLEQFLSSFVPLHCFVIFLPARPLWLFWSNKLVLHAIQEFLKESEVMFWGFLLPWTQLSRLPTGWLLLFRCFLLFKLLLLFSVWSLMLLVFLPPKLTNLFLLTWPGLEDWPFSHLSSSFTLLNGLDFCVFDLPFRWRPVLAAIQAKAPMAARYSHNPIPILPANWSCKPVCLCTYGKVLGCVWYLNAISSYGQMIILFIKISEDKVITW